MEEKLEKGVIVESVGWSEPVIVEQYEDLGDLVRILGRTQISKEFFDVIIEKTELSRLKIRKIESRFSADPKKVFLALETKRYRYISLYDPLLAVNTSVVDPLSHQIEAVYDKVLKLPRIRFFIREAYRKIIEKGYDKKYAKAVVSYLGLGVNRLADYNSSLTVWAVAGEFIAHTFGRQALPMVWDYFELDPWSNATGDWNSAVNWILDVLSHILQILPVEV